VFPVVSLPPPYYGGGMTLRSINPATGELIREYPSMDPAEVAEVVDRAHAAFLTWREESFSARAAVLTRVAEVLEAREAELARLMATEMGKPVEQGRAEVAKCAWVCRHYADTAEESLREEEVATEATRSYVTYRPLGVVLAIMPWNFPFWQVFRFAAPGLMAGNAGVLKHAGNVTGCALAIEEVFRAAGAPAHLFRALRIGSEAVGAVIDHPGISAVTLTGSTGAGRSVAAQAGAALKKTVLELGGSDAYLVLHDADVPAAARLCAESRLINAGQSCIAAKRFLVVASVREEFERHLVEAMRNRRPGDPLDPATALGPLARQDLREELHGQVQRSVAQGARLLLGGQPEEGAGAYYPPTVLTEVAPGMPAFDEELFGPVAAIVPVANEEEAVRLANQSAFGLGGAVFTRDRQRGERLASAALEAGTCVVNGFVKSDPRLPFGGIKHSGYGRELGVHGIREFVNIKTVVVN
jgi:succinate-semialdehyde dehydrogenase / glutarate-semialdehyde dehydrogenase